MAKEATGAKASTGAEASTDADASTLASGSMNTVTMLQLSNMQTLLQDFVNTLPTTLGNELQLTIKKVIQEELGNRHPGSLSAYINDVNKKALDESLEKQLIPAFKQLNERLDKMTAQMDSLSEQSASIKKLHDYMEGEGFNQSVAVKHLLRKIEGLKNHQKHIDEIIVNVQKDVSDITATLAEQTGEVRILPQPPVVPPPQPPQTVNTEEQVAAAIDTAVKATIARFAPQTAESKAEAPAQPATETETKIDTTDVTIGKVKVEAKPTPSKKRKLKNTKKKAPKTFTFSKRKNKEKYEFGPYPGPDSVSEKETDIARYHALKHHAPKKAGEPGMLKWVCKKCSRAITTHAPNVDFCVKCMTACFCSQNCYKTSSHYRQQSCPLNPKWQGESSSSSSSTSTMGGHSTTRATPVPTASLPTELPTLPVKSEPSADKAAIEAQIASLQDQAIAMEAAMRAAEAAKSPFNTGNLATPTPVPTENPYSGQVSTPSATISADSNTEEDEKDDEMEVDYDDDEIIE